MKVSHFKIILCWIAVLLVATPFTTSLKAEKTIKILAIGNSFSVDGAEAYLDDLAKAAGIKLVVANCQIGGCPLEKHWRLAQSDTAAYYHFNKITNGDTVSSINRTLISCIQDDDWDYITFQQASPFSGKVETFFPYLTNLMAFSKSHAKNPKVKFALHQTWAYASNSTHAGFANYNNNQDTMYHAIVKAINQASVKSGIKIIIPSGTAIQNGRSSFIGDHFNRDGYHLSLDLGRYTAACVWFEKLLKKSVVGNSFYPPSLTKRQVKVAQHAAHYAVKHPNEVTSMVDFTNATDVIP